MTYRQLTSKMQYHAALATDAWNHGNFTDYLIESARFSLAQRALQRRDREASHMHYAIALASTPLEHL